MFPLGKNALMWLAFEKELLLLLNNSQICIKNWSSGLAPRLKELGGKPALLTQVDD